MPIVIHCSCNKRIRVPEKLAGRRVKCPACGQPHRVPPAEGAQGRGASSQERVSRGRRVIDENSQGGGETRHLASGRWNFLISISWLILGTAVTLGAPWLALAPRWLEGVGNVLPLVVTAGLIGWNLWSSLAIIGRTGRSVLALPLTLLQILLFTLLFYQIAAHRGVGEYAWDRVAGLGDWFWFAAIHAVRAADLMDAIEAYGLRVQTIHSFGHLSAISLITYHLVVDLFFIRLLMEGVDGWKRSLLRNPQWSRWLRLLTYGLVGLFVVAWLVSAVLWRPWRVQDLLLWPLDNLLRVLDFMDAMEIYHVQLHQVPKLRWEGTLTLLCRVLMAITLAGALNRAWQAASLRWGRGFGLREDELQELALGRERESERQLAAERLRRIRERRRRSETGRIQWVAMWEVVTTIGVAGFGCIALLFLTGFEVPVERLAAAATGTDDAGAQRALRGLRRTGPSAAEAVPLLAESLSELSPQRRMEVYETLGFLGPTAVEPLATAARNGTEPERISAVVSLDRIGPRFSIPELLAAAGDDEAAARQAANEALTGLESKDLPHLIAALEPENAGAILAVLEQTDPYWRLRESSNPHFPLLVATSASLQVLDRSDSPPDAVRAAIDGLAEQGMLAGYLVAHRVAAADESSRERWTRALLDVAPEMLPSVVDKQIASVLAEIGPPAISALADELIRRDSAWSPAAEGVVLIGPPAVPVLVERVEDVDSEAFTRVRAVILQMGEPAIPTLLEELVSPATTQDESRREIIKSVLKELGEPALRELAKVGEAAFPFLLDELAGDEVYWHDAALKVFTLNPQPAVPLLLEHLERVDSGLRDRVENLIADIGEPASGPLIAALESGDGKRRDLAESLLIRIGEPAVDKLVDRLANDEGPRGFDTLDGRREKLVDRLPNHKASREGVSRILTRIGREAVPTLQRRYGAAAEPFRERIGAVLMGMPPLIVGGLAGRSGGLADRSGRATISTVGFSPDGSTGVSGFGDGTLLIWDARTGEGVHIPNAHDSRISSMAFSSDGVRLATGSVDETVKLWDARTGRRIRAFAADSHVPCVALSKDGSKVAAGWGNAYYGEIRIWEAETGEVLRELKAVSGIVLSLAFDPEGHTIASGNNDKSIRIWDIQTGNEIRAFAGHVQPVSSLTFSSDGKRIASGSNDKSIRIWNVQTGDAILTLEGHSESINSVAFDPQGDKVASGSSDKSVKLWDAESGEQVQTLDGHSLPVTKVAFRPDGNRVISASRDNTIRTWNAKSGAELRSPPIGHADVVLSVAFSPDGTRIASGSLDSTAKLWDAQTGKAIHALSGHAKAVADVAFSPDGNTIATASWDGAVRLWDVQTGKETRPPLLGHADVVRSLAFSGDGNKVATGGADKTVRLWDAQTGKELHILEHADRVNSVACSPSGDSLASGGDDGAVTVWDADTGEKIQTLNCRYNARSIAYSPDGTRIVTGSSESFGSRSQFTNEEVIVWDAQNGDKIQVFDRGARAVAFSPDGNRIAGSSRDSAVRVWDAATGENLRTLDHDSSRVTDVAFSPDGLRLAVAVERNVLVYFLAPPPGDQAGRRTLSGR